MSYPDILQAATLISGVAMSLSPLFQIKLILKRKHSADVALGWPVVILIGVVIWLLNGIYLHSTAIIISEVIGIITNGLAIILILAYRPGGWGYRREDKNRQLENEQLRQTVHEFIGIEPDSGEEQESEGEALEPVIYRLQSDRYLRDALPEIEAKSEGKAVAA